MFYFAFTFQNRTCTRLLCSRRKAYINRTVRQSVRQCPTSFYGQLVRHTHICEDFVVDPQVNNLSREQDRSDGLKANVSISNFPHKSQTYIAIISNFSQFVSAQKVRHIWGYILILSKTMADVINCKNRYMINNSVLIRDLKLVYIHTSRS